MVNESWQPAPSLNILSNSDAWSIDRPGRYLGQRLDVDFPAGWETDLASIPRLVRWIIPVNGKHRLAAILHDRLYEFYVNNGLMSRKDADEYFLCEMKALGVKRVKRYAMYYAVRAFGWHYAK